MQRGGTGKKGKEVEGFMILDIRCLNDLVQYVPVPGEAVLINVPLETKLSEYKKIVEYADAHQYDLFDDKPGMGFSMNSRVEDRLNRIEQFREDVVRKTDLLKKRLDKINERRAAETGT
uniref:MutS2 protein n=1 Tax=Anthurium amnicola TaxID=1678845 RepID=A0A1D1XJB4_9ARAE